ncbi:MAG TPA: threonine synthase [Thermomicrobiaceae bacterium]|nr:threonine synthase [Thermomicrobiaceae bacterium]
MSGYTLACQRCETSVADGVRCPSCGGVSSTRYGVPAQAAWDAAARLPGIWRYAPVLPVARPGEAVTLGEGGTPLVRSRRLAQAIGVRELWFKVEAANPTGSYKDRIAAVAVTRAVEAGRRGWLATSSGNAGAALAAYGARAGLPGIVVVPANAAPAKLAQIRAYGPRLIPVEGFGLSAGADAAVFATLEAASVEHGLALSITAHAFDPHAMDGAKTIAYEVAEQLGCVPDRVYVPAGGGGLATSLARGFREWCDLGRAEWLPTLTVVQAEGCAPIVRSWERGTDLVPVDAVDTAISGVQLASPPDGDALLSALRADDGAAVGVSDDAALWAQARLAGEEGIFVEPAAALAYAGLLADLAAGRVDGDDAIVCVLTGSGFKDRDAVERMAARRSPAAPIPIDALAAALGG